MSKRPYLTRFLTTCGATVLAFLPVAAYAQTPVSFGMKAGLNASTLHPDDATSLDLSTIWGGVAGVFVGANVTDHIGLQVEALASQRGAKVDTGLSTTSVRLTYIDVPVTIRYGRTDTDRAHFHVFTGPQVSFKVKTDSTDPVFGATDIDDEVESTDFGWTFGAGVEQGAWGVDARYTLGLMNVNSSPADPAVKNRTFSLMVGYRFK